MMSHPYSLDLRERVVAWREKIDSVLSRSSIDECDGLATRTGAREAVYE